MQINQVDQDRPNKKLIKNIVNLLKKDKIIIHPTETVYGIAGIYSSQEIIKKILYAKHRPMTQPFSIMVNNIENILSISGGNNQWLKSFLNQVFPNPVTVLIPRKKDIQPEYWNQFSYIGFRFPFHNLCQEVLDCLKIPLITTSANLSGEATPINFGMISSDLLTNVDLALDGGETKEKLPSTIVKVMDSSKSIQLIRRGAMEWNIVENVFYDSI
jgi:L-threonylcarbamoyladenylate synthase